MTISGRLVTDEAVQGHSASRPCPDCLTYCYVASPTQYAHSSRFQKWGTIGAIVAALMIAGIYLVALDRGIWPSLLRSFEVFMVLGGLVWAAKPSHYRDGGFWGLRNRSMWAFIGFWLALIAYGVMFWQLVSDFFVAAVTHAS